jgi:hypothetical protein
MTWTGTVRNGVVELDDPSGVTDGLKVNVTESVAETGPNSLHAKLLALAESMPDMDLPEDLSTQHEHYRLGTPKR